MKIALIANPESGGGEAAAAAELLRGAGAELVGEFPIDQRRAALSSGAERLVVAGGDGSIGCVAELAAEASLPLAVIAAGTANDFAAALELPDEVEDACRLAARGTLMRRLDLGVAGERAFVNAASIGLSPQAAQKASGMKSTLGPLAYPLGAIRAAISAEPVSCRVSCDGRPVFDGEAWQAIVAVTGAFGGGADVEADPGDGVLDVVVIEAGPRAKLIVRGYGLRAGEIEAQEGVVSASGRAVEIELPRPSPMNIDGELIEAGSTTFTLRPRAFEVVVG